MTLLLTTFTMLAFAGVYALLMAMLGQRAEALAAALLGRPRTPQAEATARRFSLA